MSTCPDCNQNRMTSRGCTLAYFVIDGEKHKRVTGSYEKGKSFTKEVTQGEGKQCPDCGAIEGNVHHFGCENESKLAFPSSCSTRSYEPFLK